MAQTTNDLNGEVFLKRQFTSARGLSILGFLLFFVSMTLFAAEPLRISAEQLQQTLNSPGLVILDSRSEQEYQQSHIQGALNFPEVWTYHNKSIDGHIVQPTPLQHILRKLGLNTESPVIIYDDGQMMNAARLFWTLEVYGLKNVKILNKGYADWLSLNLPLAFDQPSPVPSQYIPVINHEHLATKLTTLLASKNPNQLIIDARPNKAYRGLESSAKRFGHIPSATNIPAEHNLKQEAQITSLKPLKELQRLYADIPITKKVVLYCAIGRISTMNYFTLRELGYNVANYDASWKEWGNDFSLAIEKEAPKSATH
ncbi:sulfurtransferase [Thiomicrorhabdus arctica]|uniref:sulfurtransferase n=1 Tax=Thiomicrorhabdus arctica TaxID=131540 RepID=UPI00037C8047|nr:rhodanese-like domain-containing protein [Thiomicrorhabdus arctica]